MFQVPERELHRALREACALGDLSRADRGGVAPGGGCSRPQPEVDQECRWRPVVTDQVGQQSLDDVAIDALVTIEKLAGVRAELEVGVEALSDAAKLARARYDNGLSSYLEILIADQQLFVMELELAATRGSQMRAVAQLYRALGGGWQAGPPEPPGTPIPPPVPDVAEGPPSAQ